MDQARIDAKTRGEKVYDGLDCKHGHGKTRYTSTGGCVECSRVSALAAYHKRRDRLLAAERPVVWEKPQVAADDSRIAVEFVYASDELTG